MRGRIARAFERVARVDFLPPAQRDRVDFDGPLPIGHHMTCSQPRTVDAMLALLEVSTGQRVLDVGAGSGWTTALLAELTGPTGSVVGVEIVPELAAWGRANVAASDHPWASLVPAREGTLGHPAGAPYDRILVSADAGSLPQALIDQLADPGRMVIPVASTMTVVDLRGGQVQVSEHGGYRFVPLVEPPPVPE